MAAVKIGNYKGIYPRTARRSLGESAAHVAENVNLTSTEIRPLRNPKLVRVTPNPVTVYRAVQGAVETWREWGKRVHVIKGPLPVDVEARYYWSGDGEPRYQRFENFGVFDFALGVPTPTGVPTLAVAGGTGTNVTRFYRYTFFSSMGEESGPSPIAELTGPGDGTWTISNMSALPANAGAGVGVAKTDLGITRTEFDNGVEHWLRAGDEIWLGGQKVEVESVVSPTKFKVLGDHSAATSWNRVAPWNTGAMTRRVYRTVGSSGAWQLVRDNVAGTTFVDTFSDSQILGDDLITEGWEPPPAKLRGLGVLPSGAAYGYVNNLLCFSEPNQPHAWPSAYQLSADHEIIGAAAYGTVVVAATASKPHMADGQEPASASFTKLDAVWPCLSERSVVSVGDGVVFATSFGLAMIGLNGPQLFTNAFFTEEEWKTYNPRSMICAFSENRLFVWWQKGSRNDILLFKLAEDAPLTTSSVQCTGLYVDELDGELYITRDDGVYRFDADNGPRIPFIWESKEYELAKPMNLGAARVEFKRALTPQDEEAIEAQRLVDIAYNETVLASYNGFGSWNGSAYNEFYFNEGPNMREVAELDREYLDFELWVDDKLIYAGSFEETTSFKLPAGYRTDHFHFKLRGNVRTYPIKLAETMKGLAEV